MSQFTLIVADIYFRTFTPTSFFGRVHLSYEVNPRVPSCSYQRPPYIKSIPSQVEVI